MFILSRQGPHYKAKKIDRQIKSSKGISFNEDQLAQKHFREKLVSSSFILIHST